MKKRPSFKRSRFLFFQMTLFLLHGKLEFVSIDSDGSFVIAGSVAEINGSGGFSIRGNVNYAFRNPRTIQVSDHGGGNCGSPRCSVTVSSAVATGYFYDL